MIFLSPEKGFRAPGGVCKAPPLCFVSLSSHPQCFSAPPSCPGFALKPFGVAGIEATQSFCEQLWLQVSHWLEQRWFSLIYTKHGWPRSLRIMQFLSLGVEAIVFLSSLLFEVVLKGFRLLLTHRHTHKNPSLPYSFPPFFPPSSPFSGF